MYILLSNRATRSISFVIKGLLISFCWISMAMGARYDYVDINSPALRKIPTAIPIFKSLNNTTDEGQISGQAADMLSDMLVFTGYFKVLDRGAFLIDPKAPNIVASQIQFKNWTGIGAELLVTGGVVF